VSGGSVLLKFRTPISQYLFLFVQTMLWLLVMLAVFDVGRIKRRFLKTQSREVKVIGDQNSPVLSFAPGGDQ
jgi:hypothetical protein